MSHYSGASYHHMPMAGMPMAGVPMAGMPMGAVPVGGMPITPGYGTPYPAGNTLMMSGVGSEYGGPLTEPMVTPIYDGDRRSIYDDGRRSLYDYDYDRGYDSDYYGRGRSRSRSHYHDDDDRYYRSSSRASRRSRRGDYDDYSYGDRDYYDRYGRDYYDRDYNDRDYNRYYDDYGRGYGSSSRGYSSSYYPSSSSYYSSSGHRSSRRREDISVLTKKNGEIQVLRDGQERVGDRVRRMFGMDPKGFNIVRLKQGESIATGIRR